MGSVSARMDDDMIASTDSRDLLFRVWLPSPSLGSEQSSLVSSGVLGFGFWVLGCHVQLLSQQEDEAVPR